MATQTSRPRPNLGQLPSELLLLIIGYCKPERLSDHTSQKTLRSLCCTNRLLHRLATPVLFEEYATANNLLPFVRVLVTRPDFAELVKTVHWTTARCERKITITPSEVISALQNHNNELATRAAITLQTTLRSPEFTVLDAYLAAVLLHVPNIECLCVKSDIMRQSITRSWLPTTEHDLQHSFQHLRSIEVKGVTQLSDMAVFLGLPCLRTLTVFGLHHRPKADWTQSPRSSKLEELILLHCYLRSPDLVRLIESCQALRKFIYLNGPVKANDRHNISSMALKIALDNHALSLRELSLQNYPKARSDAEWSFTGKLNSFAQYANLAHMSLPAYISIPNVPDLFAYQLPSRLETLHLDETSSKYFGDFGKKALESLLEAPQDVLPRLESVHMEREITGSLSFIDWKALKRGLCQKNITLRTWDAGRDRRHGAGADDWYDVADC